MHRSKLGSNVNKNAFALFNSLLNGSSVSVNFEENKKRKELRKKKEVNEVNQIDALNDVVRSIKEGMFDDDDDVACDDVGTESIEKVDGRNTKKPKPSKSTHGDGKKRTKKKEDASKSGLENEKKVESGKNIPTIYSQFDVITDHATTIPPMIYKEEMKATATSYYWFKFCKCERCKSLASHCISSPPIKETKCCQQVHTGYAPITMKGNNRRKQDATPSQVVLKIVPLVLPLVETSKSELQKVPKMDKEDPYLGVDPKNIPMDLDGYLNSNLNELDELDINVAGDYYIVYPSSIKKFLFKGRKLIEEEEEEELNGEESETQWCLFSINSTKSKYGVRAEGSLRRSVKFFDDDFKKKLGSKGKNIGELRAGGHMVVEGLPTIAAVIDFNKALANPMVRMKKIIKLYEYLSKGGENSKSDVVIKSRKLKKVKKINRATDLILNQNENDETIRPSDGLNENGNNGKDCSINAAILTGDAESDGVTDDGRNSDGGKVSDSETEEKGKDELSSNSFEPVMDELSAGLEKIASLTSLTKSVGDLVDHLSTDKVDMLNRHNQLMALLVHQDRCISELMEKQRKQDEVMEKMLSKLDDERLYFTHGPGVCSNGGDRISKRRRDEMSSAEEEDGERKSAPVGKRPRMMYEMEKQKDAVMSERKKLISMKSPRSCYLPNNRDSINSGKLINGVENEKRAGKTIAACQRYGALIGDNVENSNGEIRGVPHMVPEMDVNMSEINGNVVENHYESDGGVGDLFLDQPTENVANTLCDLNNLTPVFPGNDQIQTSLVEKTGEMSEKIEHPEDVQTSDKNGEHLQTVKNFIDGYVNFNKF